MPKELDYMEYSTDALAQAAYVTNATEAIISNADIDNEDMADITDWTDSDSGTGVSTQETFDGKSCMKLLSGGTAGGVANRNQDIGAFGTRTVFSFNAYFETLGVTGDNDFYFTANNGTNYFYCIFASDGLVIYDGATWNEIGTNLVVSDVWQEWTFDCNWTTQRAEVYLDGVLKASNVDFSYAQPTTDGLIRFMQNGATTVNGLTYIDWFKAGTTTAINPNFQYLQSYSESTIKTQGSYALKAVAAITDSLNKTLTRTIT